MPVNSEYEWLAGLRSACPEVEISTDPDQLQNYGTDWTRFRQPAAGAVCFPRTVAAVQQLVRHACRNGIAMVPSGGRTGLSGGAVADRGELVVSFDRMRRIIEFNEVDRTVTVEAGIVTQSIQEFAASKGLYYPVSFAAQGSSQIGGNIATNAGGIRVLRHGLTRDRVAGLKVVTHDGLLLDCNRGLIKNASGYDLRHLFIGSEGTLGLIVEATLKLESPPPDSRVMLLGVAGLDALMRVFHVFRSGVMLSAFEFLTDESLGYVRAHLDLAAPLDSICPLYVVLEFDCVSDDEEARAMACFEDSVAAGWVVDGVISRSGQQAADLWRYREGISEAITPRTPYKNDLAVRVSRVPEFLRAMDAVVAELCPDFEVLWYGHIGDGNLHMNVLRPLDMGAAEFESRCKVISERTYALTGKMDGTISAEHGLGLLKNEWLGEVRSAGEIGLMRQLKAVFDPNGVFNPGKLLPEVEETLR